MTKKIILCADGTGNSRTSPFRTNVRKLYDTLDLTPGGGQIAYYHDGVGTDSFAPLKYVGAIFGYGVARNVRDIYKFLCRNYAPNDEIYIFGFSRGAFEARMLASLISVAGVLVSQDEDTLDRWTAQAFRRFRRRNNDGQYGKLRKALVMLWRWIRDRIDPANLKPTNAPPITFLGCWDTVSAYGGPIIEMVRGWDRWVFPLSFADYKLGAKVKRARHALALDEERESFLPLLWDECATGPGNHKRDPRIEQVWFPGVHADVGGGYPDQQLSDVPLLWMMEESRLGFYQAARNAIARNASPFGPRHDSRSGVGMAYRYQPRRIDAYTQGSLGNPSRDPATGNNQMLERAIVHSSVLYRRSSALEGYWPIALPPTYYDLSDNQCHLDTAEQAKIWLEVRARRRWQFLMLLSGLLAAFSPLAPWPWSQAAYDAPTTNGYLLAPLYWGGWSIAFANDLLRSVVRGILATIPGVPGWVAVAYSDSGGYLLIGAAMILCFIKLGRRTARVTEREARIMWSNTAPSQVSVPTTSWNRFWWPWRRWARWTAAPAAFGVGYWFIFLWCGLGGVGRIATTADHIGFRWDQASTGEFKTSDRIYSLQRIVDRGRVYSLQMAVSREWIDGDSKDATRTSPLGFSGWDSVRQHWGGAPLPLLSAIGVHLIGFPLRQEIGAKWFAPVVAVRSKKGGVHTVTLSMRDVGGGVYRGSFVAPASGPAYLYVNDTPGFYGNNHGAAIVELCGDCFEDATAPGATKSLP